MTLQFEDEFIGKESHEVPTVDPDDKCNAKRTVTINFDDWSKSVEHVDKEVLDAIKEENSITNHKNRSGTKTYFKGYCGNWAGKGTDHTGEGRCEYHAGKVATGAGTGAPAHNQHNLKHGANADPHHYHQNLDPEEKEFVEDTSSVILERIRRLHGREPDFMDEIIARRVSIKLHMVSYMSDYTRDQMVQVVTHPDGGSHEEKGALLEEVRRFDNSIMSNLKDLGILEDPDSQKADVLEQWRDFVTEATEAVEEAAEEAAEDDEVIDIEATVEQDD